MGYTQPNESTATYEEQARGYGQEIEQLALAMGLWPMKSVLDGCAVGASTGMQLSVGAGVVWYDETPYVVSSATPTVSTAHASNSRIDYVAYDTGSTAVDIIAGTAAANPDPPTLDADHVLLAEINVPATTTTITTGHIVDKRVIPATPVDQGTIYVDPTNGTDPGSSTWAGWGRRREVAVDNTADAIGLASSGDSIVLLGNESLTTVVPTTSKKLRFFGARPGAGWTWSVIDPAGDMFAFTGDGCEWHNLSFGTSYAGIFANAFIDANTADDGLVTNCIFNGTESTTQRVQEGVRCGTGWKFDSCTFDKISEEGIDATGQVIVTGSSFWYNGTSITNTASSGYSNYHSNITGCTFKDAQYRSIDMRYCNVTGNTFVFTDAVGATTLSGVRVRAESNVVGNRFQGELTTDDISNFEMIELDDGSSAVGNWIRMGNRWDGFAIATLGTTGGNFISGNRVRSSQTIDHSVIQLRGQADACVGNYFYIVASGSNDDIIGIDSNYYGQYVADNFFEDRGTDAGGNITYVSPYASGQTVMRGNRFREHGLNNEVYPIPEETVNIVSTATTVDMNDELMQISGTNAVTLPSYTNIPATKTFKFQRVDSSNNSTINTNSGTQYIWYDGTVTYTSISLASDGATVEVYYDGTYWRVLSERGTVNYT